MTEKRQELVAQIFKKLLQKCDTKAYRVAKETGIDKTYLSKLCAGAIARPGADKLAKIAAVLNIEIEQLQQVFREPRLAIAELELEDVEFAALSTKKESFLSKQDWGTAPDALVCYHRSTEIEQLKQAFKTQHCRLATIYGLDGIGKTTVAIEVAQQMKTEFDYILWRTLGNDCPAEIWLQDALRLFTKEILTLGIESQTARLMQYLRQHRCLVVLDGVEAMLATGSSLQPYRFGYEAYGEVFRQAAQIKHQSCLLLVSNEKPRDVAVWESASAAIYSLQIRGSKEVCYRILQDKQITYSSAWDELIAAYRGHPLALKIVATAIEELFAGNVADFLRQNTLFLGDLQFLLHQQYQRLSEPEQQILKAFSEVERPVSLGKLTDQYQNQMRCSQIIECLHSLKRRSLLDRVVSKDLNSDRPQTYFYDIHPMVRKYMQSQN